MGKKYTRHYKSVSDIEDSTSGDLAIGTAKAVDDAGTHCGLQIVIDRKTKRIAIVIIYKDSKTTYIIDKQ